MYTTGTDATSVTPLIRCWRSSNRGTPSSSSATTSPSTMACWASIQRGGLSSFGK